MRRIAAIAVGLSLLISGCQTVRTPWSVPPPRTDDPEAEKAKSDKERSRLMDAYQYHQDPRGSVEDSPIPR